MVEAFVRGIPIGIRKSSTVCILHRVSSLSWIVTFLLLFCQVAWRSWRYNHGITLLSHPYRAPIMRLVALKTRDVIYMYILLY